MDAPVNSTDRGVPIGTCGDPFKYQVPKPEGDPWEVLLTPLIAKDKQQCDGWKEEVENLLIFAGLFSAVVTAFVVDVYKQLQPDPNDTVIALLTLIATNLDGNSNGTSVDGLPESLTSRQGPSSGIMRINALWFTSLVLSLTDVLVGTVALQWLRAHQRYPVQMDPRTKFAVFNMRRESLEAWYVPQVFSALPMLLQVSLLLFFSGLIEFLLVYAPTPVMIPIVVFTALPITFLIVTTMIPSFQWIVYPATYFRFWKNIPSECPYKSPQSSALSSFLSPLLRRMLAFIDDGKMDIWLRYLYEDFQSLEDGLLALYYRTRFHEEEHRMKVKEVQKTYPNFKRQEYEPTTWTNLQSQPVYDWLSGLFYANANSNFQLSVQEACYHSTLDLIKISSDNHRFYSHQAWCYFIQNTILGLEDPHVDPKPPRYQILGGRLTPNEVVNDDLSMDALQTFTRADISPEHACEIHIRLMKFYLPMMLEFEDRLSKDDDWQFHTWHLGNPSNIYRPDISDEYTGVLKTLMTGSSYVSTPIKEEVYMMDEFPLLTSLVQFIDIAVRNQDRARTQEAIQFTKDIAQKHLRIERPPSDRKLPFRLFFSAAIYCGSLLYWKDDDWNMGKDNVFAELLSLLSQFQNDLDGTILDITPGDEILASVYFSKFEKACSRIIHRNPPRPSRQRSRTSLTASIRVSQDDHSDGTPTGNHAAIDIRPPRQDSMDQGIELQVMNSHVRGVDTGQLIDKSVDGEPIDNAK